MSYAVVRAGAVEPGELIHRRVSKATGMDSVWEEVTEVRTRVVACENGHGETVFRPLTTLAGAHGDMLSCDSNRRIMVRLPSPAVEVGRDMTDAEAAALKDHWVGRIADVHPLAPLPPLPSDVHQPIKRGS